MPIAKALTIERITASTAVTPEMKIEFHSFSGKLTRFQKFTMPVKSSAWGRASGPPVA